MAKATTEQYRPFTINVVPVRTNVVGMQNNCNGVSFYNAGNTVAVVNGFPMLPKMGWTPFEPNPREIDITNYTVSFDESGVATPANYLLVVRKSYQDA